MDDLTESTILESDTNTTSEPLQSPNKDATDGKERSRTFRRRRLSHVDLVDAATASTVVANAKDNRKTEKSNGTSHTSGVPLTVSGSGGDSGADSDSTNTHSGVRTENHLEAEADDGVTSHRAKRKKTDDSEATVAIHNDLKDAHCRNSNKRTNETTICENHQNEDRIDGFQVSNQHEDANLHYASTTKSSTDTTCDGIRTETTLQESTTGDSTSKETLSCTATPQSQIQTPANNNNNNNNNDSFLPFPRTIVGTYSCHGVEPLYESDSDDEDDSQHQHPKHPSSSSSSNQATPRPTCVAKINQDRGGVAYPYARSNRTAVFATYDGHGDGGELVAQYALHEVPKRLERHDAFRRSKWAANVDGEGGDIEQAFREVFLDVDRGMETEGNIDPMYSGCTACVVLMRGRELVCSNLGDSRAVMAVLRKPSPDEQHQQQQQQLQQLQPKQSPSRYEALNLTIDQNPDSPGEQERIERMGGFVSPQEEGLSARVWLDNNRTQIGLAMSRSFGDHSVRPVGVIAEPVVSYHTITDGQDEFMIVATDGVWEFLSSQDAVNIVGKDLDQGLGSSVACQHLIEAAAAKWHEYEGDYRDDITALVVRVTKLWEPLEVS